MEKRRNREGSGERKGDIGGRPRKKNDQWTLRAMMLK